MRRIFVIALVALGLAACQPQDNFTGPGPIGPSISQIKAAIAGKP